MMRRVLTMIAVLSACVGAAQARPYYAAKKGLSCAACHIAPSGAGMRKVRETSPGRVTDHLSVGADLRAYFSQIEKTKVSTFRVARSALYVQASPRPDIDLVYHNDDAITAQVYGIWRKTEGLPLYVRAGRFWIPYGLQWDVPDNSSFIHTSPFAGSVGFDMSVGASDTGVEVGLAPKDRYFLNASLTNGQPAGSTDNNERKAFSTRGGLIWKHLMLGGSLYQDKTGPLAFHKSQTRYGPMGWVFLKPFAFLFEGGFGEDKPNSGGKTKLAGHAAELDVEPVEGWLGKLRYDSIDPDTGVSGDDRQRYAFCVERLMEWVSLELQYRNNIETPSARNDEVFLQAHVWF